MENTATSLAWDPLAAEPLSQQAVTPMLARHGGVLAQYPLAESLAWTNDELLPSAQFLTDIKEAYRRYRPEFEPGPMVFRRCATLVPSAVVRLSLAQFPAEPEARLQAVMEIWPAVAKQLSRLSRRAPEREGDRSAVPALHRVESDAVLPLIILLQAGGQAMEALLTQPMLTPRGRLVAQSFAREWADRLPLANQNLWRSGETIVAADVSGGLVLKHWAVGGLFPRDPLQNPILAPRTWDGVENEPLFRGLCAQMVRSAKLAWNLANRAELRLPTDTVQRLQQLGGDQPDNPARASVYFSVHRNVVLNSPARDGADIASPLRAQAIRSLYNLWTAKLAELGKPLLPEHLRGIASVQSHFAPETWTALTQPPPPLLGDVELSSVLGRAAPWTPAGSAPVWAVAGLALRERAKILRGMLRLSDRETPQTVLAQIKEPGVNPKEWAERMQQTVRFMHDLKFIKTLRSSGTADETPADSRDYWRRVLLGQGNPMFGLPPDRSLLIALLPAAYWAQTKALLGDIVRDRTALGPGGIQLAEAIWLEAVERARLRPAASLEQCFLGAALAVSKSEPRFTTAEAFAFTFALAMGTNGATGKQSRLLDCSVERQRERGRFLTGRTNASELLFTGGASVLAQVVRDAETRATQCGGERSTVAGVPELLAATLALKHLAREEFGVVIGARGTFGSLLKNPVFWENALPSNPLQRDYLDRVAAERGRPAEALAKVVLPVLGSGHPMVAPAWSSALQAFTYALVQVQQKQPLLASEEPRTNTLDLSVLDAALSEVTPAIDAMLARPSRRKGFSAMVQEALAPDKAGGDWEPHYVKFLQDQQNVHSVYGLLGQADAAMALTAKKSAVLSPWGAVALLGDRASMTVFLDAVAGPVRTAKALQVFRAGSNGSLGSNALAVGWAQALRNTFAAADRPDLQKACTVFLEVEKEIRRTTGAGTGTFSADARKVWDQHFGTAARGIFTELEKNPPQPVEWEQLKQTVTRGLHGYMATEAEAAARVYRTAEGPAGLNGQANAMVTLLTGLESGAGFALRVTRDLQMALPRPKAAEIAPPAPEPTLRHEQNQPLPV
jgi:hypothetical protein